MGSGITKAICWFFSEYSHVPKFAKNDRVSLCVPAGNGDGSRKKPPKEAVPTVPRAAQTAHPSATAPLCDDTLTRAVRRALEVQVHGAPRISLGKKSRSKRITN